jgi:hypothetical protein
MLALTTSQVQPGDVAVRTDGTGTFILTATDPSQISNWTRLNAPTDAVTTVNGQSGDVVLAASDVGAYVRPTDGIPSADMSAAVQASLASVGSISRAASIGTSGIGVTARGITIPAGSLDTWRAARDGSDTTLVEVAIFGDSTTSGVTQGSDGGSYSWVTTLRKAATVAGTGTLHDGGRGVTALWDNDNIDLSQPDGYLPVLARTGFTANQRWGVRQADEACSNVAGESITFKGHCTKIRLNYVGSNDTDQFTYQVDNGAIVTVTPPTHNGAGYGRTVETEVISGLTDGDHTVTIVNTSRDVGKPWVVISPEFIRDNGLVFHKVSGGGASIDSYFDHNRDELQFAAAAMMGLDPQATSLNGWSWGLPRKSGAKARNVKLTVFALGINNCNVTSEPNFTDIATAQMRYQLWVEQFVQMSRAAGADPVICIPHFQIAGGGAWSSSSMRAAYQSVAESWGVPLIDWNVILGPITSWPGKGWPDVAATLGQNHLRRDAYDAIGHAMWNNLLSL